MTAAAMTITDAAAQLRAGTVTSVQLLRAAIANADRVDPHYGVYLHRRDTAALQDAVQADADFSAGIDRGPLQGIPLGVKDVVATKDEPTTAQSLVLGPHWGDGVDAPVIARLRAAGAVITGKTTTMEFAAGCPDPDQPFPIPRNPWDPSRWAGGSSSGTASGIATGCFLGGVGTDTLGSVRGPAAFSGVTGIKPTFGRVPKSRIVPLVWSFDHCGPLARSARDCALLLQVMAGYDDSDPRSADLPVPDYAAALDGSVDGLRIGVEREHHTRAPGVDASVVARFEDAIRQLEDAGAKCIDVSLPDYEAVKTACAVVVFAEAFNYHRTDLRSRWLDYGRDTRLILGAGALLDACDLVQAHRVLATARRRTEDLFQSVDLIATPTNGTGAPPLEGLGFLTLMAMPVFTHIWDGLRNPAISVPIGFTDDGLPVGMQLAGGLWNELTVLRAADAYQQRTDWHLRLPPATAP